MYKKKYIFLNPIEEFVARDFIVDVKNISLKEHKKIYASIHTNKIEYPLESLLTSMAYFHCLASQ